MASLMNRAIKGIWHLYLRTSRALAEERQNRMAIEREIFGGRAKLSTKNDDDLPSIQ